MQVLVRVIGTSVHFRTYPPASLEVGNVRWYASPRETFIAIDRKEGASEIPGEKGYWYHLVNLASEERGWVYAEYVAPIPGADQAMLTQLGTDDKPQSESPWSFINMAAVATIATFLVTLLKMTYDFLLLLTRKISIPRPIKPPANDNAYDPRLDQESQPIFFGTSGGAPWFYRPRARHQGGGVKSA
jgi:hypothetical protein